MLFLLVFTCISCLCDWSSAAVHYSDLSDTKPCVVASPFNSPLVSAYLEEEVTSSGCVSNTTVAGSGAEVHIISYHSDLGEQNLELNLVDHESNGFQTPFIVILSSNVKAHWQVRIKRNPKDLAKHTFVASKGSGIRFANKRLESRPSLLKPKNLPSDDDSLLSYIKKRFGAVTSFTKLQGGNIVNLVVGKVAATSSSSSSLTTPSSPSLSSPPSSSSLCSIQSGHQVVLNANGITRTPRNVEGCLVDSRHDMFAKHAYVVELQHVQYEPFEVNLEIKRESRQSVVDREFWLVLKSPNHVTWRVHNRKVQGYIKIVANSFVDMSGIRMQEVAVRSEELQATGRDLLHWVEYFLGPVAMYTSMNNTNNIQITLPQMYNTETQQERPPPTMGPEWGTAKNLAITLKRALRTECSSDSVTVAIDKNVLQMLGIKKSTVTLIDPQCKAVENSTHVYIQSTSEACGTNYMDIQFGKMAFINTLVIHNSNTITEETDNADNLADNLESAAEEGSGFEDIFSGSGEQELSDMVLDDEDLKLRPMKISFMCTVDVPVPVVVNTVPPVPQPIEIAFQLQLFQSILYMVPYGRSPIDVVHPQGRLYLQASIMAEPRLRAVMQHCWLGYPNDQNMENKYTLVQNGCAVDDSVTYPIMPNSPPLPQSERLSFSLVNYGKTATSPEVFLKCQLTVCCIDKQCGGLKYPLCEDQAMCDTRHPPRENSGRETPPVRVVVLGPINMPASIRKTDGTEYTTKVEESSKTGETTKIDKQDQVMIQGLDSGTVVGIAFAAFIIGVLMMGALWFIHTHSGSLFTSGPFKRSLGNRGSTETEADYGETTPGSSAPIST